MPAGSVRAVDVRFEGDALAISLSDARTVTVDLARIPWLAWLRDATAEQRAQFQIEAPEGLAIYWPDLDDGIEVVHLLGPWPIQ